MLHWGDLTGVPNTTIMIGDTDKTAGELFFFYKRNLESRLPLNKDGIIQNSLLDRHDFTISGKEGGNIVRSGCKYRNIMIMTLN